MDPNMDEKSSSDSRNSRPSARSAASTVAKVVDQRPQLSLHRSNGPRRKAIKKEIETFKIDIGDFIEPQSEENDDENIEKKEP